MADPMTGEDQALGGLLVVTGEGEEQLEDLAALLSESLPAALWLEPTEEAFAERSALACLASGVTVVEVAPSEARVGQLRELADRFGARLLLVRVVAPHALARERARSSAGLDERLVLSSRASFATQLEQVLAAWKRPRERMS